MIEQRWCTVNGCKWTLTKGKYLAEILLANDELRYRGRVIGIEGSVVIWFEDFDDIKKAKAACVETIEDAEDNDDAMAVLADQEDTSISEVEL